MALCSAPSLDTHPAASSPIDGMLPDSRARARWPDGKTRFCAPQSPTQGLQEAEELGSKKKEAQDEKPAPLAWNVRSVGVALKAGARSLGAPEGWGWHWGAAVIFDVVSNLLPMADAALWTELVWALGAHPQALREIVALARREAERPLHAAEDRPLHWPGGRAFTLDSGEEGLGEGWLMAQWVERYAIGRQLELESAWSQEGFDRSEKEKSMANAAANMAQDMDACLAIWAAAGGKLSRKLQAPGIDESTRKKMIYAARCRVSGHLLLAAQERILGAQKALALLRAGAPLDEAEDHCLAGWLSAAAARPDAVAVFKAADAAGANFNATGAFGGTPLHAALSVKNGSAFDWLAERVTGLGGAAALRRAQEMMAACVEGIRYGGHAAGSRASQPESQAWLGRRIAEAEARELQKLIIGGDGELIACRVTRL